MAASIYNVNRAINKPIEFQGLKGQYIAYLAIGLVCLLLLFAVLYIIGISLLICLPLILLLGTLLFVFVYQYSAKYGQYGLLKKAAKRNLPEYIRCSTPNTFKQLLNRK